MATSNYDVNVQIALATTAEHEGDLDTALEFLAEAHRLAHDGDRITHARVHWTTALFHARHLTRLPMMKQLSLSMLAAVF
jgi:hypothetical protein